MTAAGTRPGTDTKCVFRGSPGAPAPPEAQTVLKAAVSLPGQGPLTPSTDGSHPAGTELAHDGFRHVLGPTQKMLGQPPRPAFLLQDFSEPLVGKGGCESPRGTLGLAVSPCRALCCGLCGKSLSPCTMETIRKTPALGTGPGRVGGLGEACALQGVSLGQPLGDSVPVPALPPTVRQEGVSQNHLPRGSCLPKASVGWQAGHQAWHPVPPAHWAPWVHPFPGTSSS